MAHFIECAKDASIWSYTGASSVEKEKAKKSASATRDPFYFSPSVAVQNVQPDVACKDHVSSDRTKPSKPSKD